MKEDYRGIGIETSLMKKTIDYTKESGCHKMRCEMQVSNWNSPAIDFYKSLGAQNRYHGTKLRFGFERIKSILHLNTFGI